MPKISSSVATQIHKYATIFKLSWESGLVYRASLLIWRLRQFLSTLMALTVWTVIFNTQSSAFGYSRAEMTSYVFLISVLQSLILASSLHNLAGEIYSGNMSQHFVKPENIFLSFTAVEAADKLRNLLFCIGESVLLFMLFQPVIVSPFFGYLGSIFSLGSVGDSPPLFVTIIFGTLGFWSNETWGPKFVFFMILDFAAGKLYPLDILPRFIQQLLYLTPFPYFSYAQIQLFLGRFSPTQVAYATTGLVFWLGASYWLMMTLWNRGIKGYEAMGQ